MPLAFMTSPIGKQNQENRGSVHRVNTYCARNRDIRDTVALTRLFCKKKKIRSIIEIEEADIKPTPFILCRNERGKMNKINTGSVGLLKKP